MRIKTGDRCLDARLRKRKRRKKTQKNKKQTKNSRVNEIFLDL